MHWKQKIDILHLQQTPLLVFPPAGSSSPADMECGGGELSDSGSSGYWSWDHGNVSPAPSPSVTEVDSSPDEGLHMELDQGDELSAKKPKVRARLYWCVLSLSDLTSVLLHLHGVPSLPQSSFRGVYRCLWPSCGKVLTSSVGIKRHIRVLHLGWVGFVLDLIHVPSYVTFLCIWKSIRATNEKQN